MPIRHTIILFCEEKGWVILSLPGTFYFSCLLKLYCPQSSLSYSKEFLDYFKKVTSLHNKDSKLPVKTVTDCWKKSGII